MTYSDLAWRAALSSSLNLTPDVAETLAQWMRLCQRIGSRRPADLPSFSFSLPLADLLSAWTDADTELPLWTFSGCATPVKEWSEQQVANEVALALNWPAYLQDKLLSCQNVVTGRKLLRYFSYSEI
jgi:hypothetical protein